MTTLLLLAIVALVLVNGFFVAAEFALVSARRGQVRGDSLAARLARRQQDKLDELPVGGSVGDHDRVARARCDRRADAGASTPSTTGMSMSIVITSGVSSAVSECRARAPDRYPLLRSLT
jgi:hypothetical protein